MYKVFAVGFLALFSLTAFGVEPAPKAPGKIESSESMGAIKVEQRPAVPAEKLQEQDRLAKKKETHKTEPPSEHLFGLHAGVSVPHPLNYGLNYVHPSHLFSFEFSTGGFGATVSDVKARIENMEIGLRWHPFAGSFFVGALLGNQKITGERTATYSGITATAKAEVKSTYATPHLGWMWGGSSKGFFINYELGVQLPSGVTTDVGSDAPAWVQATPDYQSNAKDVRDQAEKIGKSAFPYMTLIKFGYLF